MSEPIIRCNFDKLVNPSSLKAFPKNRNKHSKEQVERLSRIIEYQGWRYPVKVSNRSGFVTSGHGRIEAALLKNWSSVPVNYQDYDSDEQEYADVQADNAIASWAELDFSGINSDLGDLGPDFDIDFLGLKNFLLEPAERLDPDDEWEGMPEFSHDDKTSYQKLIVHFPNELAVKDFSRLVKQSITDKTRSIWFPKAEIEKMMDKRYSSSE